RGLPPPAHRSGATDERRAAARTAPTYRERDRIFSLFPDVGPGLAPPASADPSFSYYFLVEETEDINRLIQELNAEGRQDATREADAARLTRWLEVLLERGGSDLLLVAGSPPCVRVDGAVL